MLKGVISQIYLFFKGMMPDGTFSKELGIASK